MRILSTVIQISARSVADIGQDLAMRDTVTAQAVGDEPPRLVLQPVQQSLEEPLRRRCIASALHQNIQHDPVLVHRTPQVMQHAVDPDEDLVQVPLVARPGPAALERGGKRPAEAQAPGADALVADHYAALGQDRLDLAQAQAEAVVEPYGVGDDLGREAEAAARLRLPPTGRCRGSGA